jgi:hypothetical protein
MGGEIDNEERRFNNSVIGKLLTSLQIRVKWTGSKCKLLGLRVLFGRLSQYLANSIHSPICYVV